MCGHLVKPPVRGKFSAFIHLTRLTNIEQWRRIKWKIIWKERMAVTLAAAARLAAAALQAAAPAAAAALAAVAVAPPAVAAARRAAVPPAALRVAAAVLAVRPAA